MKSNSWRLPKYADFFLAPTGWVAWLSSSKIYLLFLGADFQLFAHRLGDFLMISPAERTFETGSRAHAAVERTSPRAP